MYYVLLQEIVYVKYFFKTYLKNWVVKMHKLLNAHGSYSRNL